MADEASPFISPKAPPGGAKRMQIQMQRMFHVKHRPVPPSHLAMEAPGRGLAMFHVKHRPQILWTPPG